MELLKEILEILNKAGSFEKSRNFYFERHQCPETQQEIQIRFDYHTYKENSKTGYIDLVHFGYCPDCNTVYYNIDCANSVKIR